MLRDNGWDSLCERVAIFCDKYHIEILDMVGSYTTFRGRRHQKEQIIVEHRYKLDIFNAVIDTQLHELDDRFNERVVELLVLSFALDPKNDY